LALRAVPGVEVVADGAYARAMRLPHGDATVVLRPRPDHVAATLRLADVRDLAPAVARCRRLLDLDADPVAVDAVLGSDPALAASVAAEPGVRVPRAVDGFEIALRAIVGQQVSLVGGLTLLGRIAAAADRMTGGSAPAVDGDGDGDGHDPAAALRPFPHAAVVAELPDRAFAMPAARAATIRTLAAGVASGELLLDGGADRDATVEALRGIPGIGEWTAGYVAMRALGDPDVFLETDLAVRRAAARTGLPDTRRGLSDYARTWAPWRSYAVIRLWRK
ncbi:MAG TPA: AlkA N-terminal domain-containing protein, partial [Micromonosporaceae bacterium]|nr:AlkA N-terminal domain-containing protein [Micromonosporaceae bacterium]